MTQAKHTPGPWRARFDEVIDVVASDSGRVAIATNLSLHARRDTNEVEANAHLIAAAPELLDAIDHPVLRQLFGAIEDSGTVEAQKLWALCAVWFGIRDAAITKASGGAA